jgi:hypothetical protein
MFKTDVLNAYQRTEIREITSALQEANIHSSMNELQNNDGLYTFLYIDNSFAFSPLYNGTREVIADGARAFIFLFDSGDRVCRIILNNPTAG